ncbi:MAG TPA: hypothetical protein PKA53_11295, partial [Sphingobacterium sp.]|nr:hypothetical protein [Sphingobacterium sp.]
YFQEDKPYGGIATPEELQRIHDFVQQHDLAIRTFEFDPEYMISCAFKHYVSQVEDVYKIGIRNRAKLLQGFLVTERPCDQIYVVPKKQ